MSKNKHNHTETKKDLKEEKDKIFPEQSTQEKETQPECHKEEKNECEETREQTSEEKKLIQEIETLNTQVSTLKEALLRNQAELQNYKRRKEEESEKNLKYKNEDLIKEILNIVDNFERAIKMDDNDLSDEVSKFLAGFKLIYTNTINILNKFEVSEISAEGVEFDPSFHHAVLTDHDENKPAGVVLEVLQKGYLYKDRVIRPAMVKVNE